VNNKDSQLIWEAYESLTAVEAINNVRGAVAAGKEDLIPDILAMVSKRDRPAVIQKAKELGINHPALDVTETPVEPEPSLGDSPLDWDDDGTLKTGPWDRPSDDVGVESIDSMAEAKVKLKGTRWDGLVGLLKENHPGWEYEGESLDSHHFKLSLSSRVVTVIASNPEAIIRIVIDGNQLDRQTFKWSEREQFVAALNKAVQGRL